MGKSCFLIYFPRSTRLRRLTCRRPLAEQLLSFLFGSAGSSESTSRPAVRLLQGYYGCAAGKAKSAARSEIEKLKLADMTCAELAKEAAKM